MKVKANCNLLANCRNINTSTFWGRQLYFCGNHENKGKLSQRKGKIFHRRALSLKKSNVVLGD